MEKVHVCGKYWNVCATFCSWFQCMFSPSWAYMSVMLFHIRQLPSFPVHAQSPLAVLYKAKSNYGLKLVLLTGELIPQCYQALTFTKWTQRNFEWEAWKVFVLENPDVTVWVCAVGFESWKKRWNTEHLNTLNWIIIVSSIYLNTENMGNNKGTLFTVVVMSVQAELQGPGGIQSRGYFLYRVWKCLCQEIKTFLKSQYRLSKTWQYDDNSMTLCLHLQPRNGRRSLEYE